VLFELRIELIEDDARLDNRGCRHRVDVKDPPEMLADVDDQRSARCLTALTGTRSARQDRDLQVTRDRESLRNIPLRRRDEHAQGQNLIDRGVGRVAPSRSAIKQDASAGFFAQAAFEAGDRL